MLVHAKSPRGILYLGPYTIYGKETGREPVDIPFDLYNSCKDGLQDATYREGFLRSKFGYPCSEIAFTYSELRFLPEHALLMIADACAVRRKKHWGQKRIIDAIKIKLREISP